MIARLGPDEGEEALLEPHDKEFDITGRPMKGWVLVVLWLRSVSELAGPKPDMGSNTTVVGYQKHRRKFGPWENDVRERVLKDLRIVSRNAKDKWNQ